MRGALSMDRPMKHKHNIENYRLPECMEVVYQTGTLHQRMALRGGPTPGTSEFLADDGALLPPGEVERTLVGGVVVARAATGGLSLRNGNLRDRLAQEASSDDLGATREKKAAMCSGIMTASSETCPSP